jgi:hypothetical protein
MKGVFALAALALLAGCSSMNMFNKAEPADKWTTWTCDSKAEVNWRFANPARTECASCSTTPPSNGYGIPAFNVNNLEQVQAVMAAADEVGAPVILQASAGARKYAGEPSSST